MRLWDNFTYQIAGHYLSALINGDTSGLSDAEERALNAFIDAAERDARGSDWTVGHWDCDSDDEGNFAECDVSGLLANVVTVRLMVYADEPQTLEALATAYQCRNHPEAREATRDHVRALCERMRNIRAPLDVDAFTSAYITAALWSSTDPDSGEPLDETYSADDLADETRASMREDCADFVRSNARNLRRFVSMWGLDITRAGIDFWLTRNGHGAGYWDRGNGPVFDALTSAAKVYGSCDIIPGEDGRLYV